MLAVLENGSPWEAFLAAEPAPHRRIGPAELDDVARALAHISDLKSVYFATHSTRVAELADGAARQAGLPAAELTQLRRAGLVHDLGRAGVPNAIWDKPARLGFAEWERVRMHAYYTDRILARAAPLAGVHALAFAAHERLDASGYHRALPASLQSRAARILAAADALAAMQEPRPHRPALDPDAAARELAADVRAGRLDREAVDAVLASGAGARAASSPRHMASRPHGSGGSPAPPRARQTKP